MSCVTSRKGKSTVTVWTKPYLLSPLENHKWMAIHWICNYSSRSLCVSYVARGKNEKVTALISPHSPFPRSPEERWSRGVYERENKNETAMAGWETICLHSWHSGMIIHFNDKTWDKGFVRLRTYTHKGVGAVDCRRHCRTFSWANTWGSGSPSKSSEQAGMGWARGWRVHAARSVGNYVRRQFGGNQREIWGGLRAKGSQEPGERTSFPSDYERPSSSRLRAGQINLSLLYLAPFISIHFASPPLFRLGPVLCSSRAPTVICSETVPRKLAEAKKKTKQSKRPSVSL